MSAHNGGGDGAGAGAGNSGASPQRRRNFPASRQDDNLPVAETPPFPILFPIEKEEEDVPLLTEVIPVEEERETPVPEKASPVPPAASQPQVSVEELAAQMTEAISRQMAYELPTLVEATLLSASEDLRSGIVSTMEAALRDFIANYKNPPPDSAG